VENITSSKLFTTRQGTITLGVIAAVIAAIALIVYLNSYRNSVNKPPVDVLVAQKLIPKDTPGDVIRNSPGYYKITSIANAQVESGAIVNPESLSGKISTTEISPGQQLTESDFGTSNNSLTSQLGRTDRAVVVDLESPNQVGGQITAGSAVDVWVAFNGSGSNGISRPVAKLLFQDMKVLAVASSGGNVTLEANSSQAGTLIFATENATIYLTLRPAVGTVNSSPPLITVNSLLAGKTLRVGG
jgi:Flp pilus assembly protein CpaB